METAEIKGFSGISELTIVFTDGSKLEIAAVLGRDDEEEYPILSLDGYKVW